MTINLNTRINMCIFAHLKWALRCVERLCAFLGGGEGCISQRAFILLRNEGGGVL